MSKSVRCIVAQNRRQESLGGLSLNCLVMENEYGLLSISAVTLYFMFIRQRYHTGKVK